ncbi:Mut7-C RNAse domain-containing protein [Modicisalibacter luteus]|uniref:Mut7-C RNAse domain-containing protein n=1 Tax=Modicisalibacter luteus TaxID=453962 RepID=A0ABV7M397_9GAMM|nr:Mut7-C RNAse domain-containing protein [Halomonas lutea]GHA83518.1 hypothetical protein GCM10007159_00490 [Halomonas lutea]
MTMRTNSRFLADAMLGRLARWLRVLDFDTVFDPAIDDPELVALADTEGRILLTRDRHLVEYLQPARSVLITRDAPLEQLRQVIETCRLEPPPALFTRCMVCNTPLRHATEDEAATLQPGRARTLPGPVWRCPGCLRVYWPGTHTWRMRETLQQALPEWL